MIVVSKVPGMLDVLYSLDTSVAWLCMATQPDVNEFSPLSQLTISMSNARTHVVFKNNMSDEPYWTDCDGQYRIEP